MGYGKESSFRAEITMIERTRYKPCPIGFGTRKTARSFIPPRTNSFMRIILLLLSFLLATVAFAQSTAQPTSFNVDSFLNAKRTAPLGKRFLAFTATTGGRTVSNEYLKNKVVLINFWFEGCLPCMAEMEALNELQQQLKGEKDFLFISFTWENPEAIKRVRQTYKISFATLSISDAEFRRLNFDNGFPTHLILDRTGTIKYLQSGGSTDKKEARAFVMQQLLLKIKGEL